MAKPFLRTPYNYDTNAVSDETGLKCEDETLAKQSFAEEVDINTIVRRFGLTGELPQNVRIPVSGDFTDVQDFHSAMNAVRLAQESFDAMPADVRTRFGNDPEKFVAFCLDDKNRAEAERLGLVDPSRAVARLKVPSSATVNPTPGDAQAAAKAAAGGA